MNIDEMKFNHRSNVTESGEFRTDAELFVFLLLLFLNQSFNFYLVIR